jgi:transcriptional regulator with XRE-family HTH domain
MPFGAVLRRQRLAAGLSLTDLALRVHYSKSHLSKIETGHKAPSHDLARRCDAALGTDGALTALIPTAAHASAPPISPKISDDQWIISMDGSGRGGFDALTRVSEGAPGHRGASAGAATVPLTWSMSSAAGHSRRLVEIGSLWTLFDQMRRLGQAMPPATLLPMLVTQTHALRLLAVAAAPPFRTEALLLAARFGEHAGWVAQEAGDDRGALWWTDRAVEYAIAAGDRDLSAYALVRRGLMAMYRHDVPETISVARQAQAARCGPRVRGLAALREAQGHALAGSYYQCRAALDRAEALLASAPAQADGRPPLGSTTTPNLVAWVTGWCLHDLGHPRRALNLLQLELASVPEHAHRTLARIGVRYTLALVSAGELEHACTMFDRLLDAIVVADSATVRVDLRRLAHELGRRHTHRAVRDVLPRLIGALSSPP